jgi:hypothetical protein
MQLSTGWSGVTCTCMLIHMIVSKCLFFLLIGDQEDDMWSVHSKHFKV